MPFQQKNLQYIFNPKSIAIIGASRNPEKAGGAILENLLKSGYEGKIFAVNSEAEVVQGIESQKSIEFIGSKVDLAIIVVPALFAAEILKKCGELKIKAAIIISSGFKEIGKDGEKIENEISEIAQKFGIALLGPNCLGVINTENNLNVSFAAMFAKKGNVALVSQSGAIVSSLVDWGNENGMGFSKIVSLGNKADIDETDILEYLAQDKETKVISLYLETISRGKEFIKIAEKISFKKPIVALKTGISQAGQAASQSHTGALATEDRIIDAVLRKSKIIRVSNTEDLLMVSQLLSFEKNISRKIFVVSNAGGLAVSSVDIAASNNLKLSEITASERKKIHTVIPKFLSAGNPLDIGGDAKSGRYRDVFKIICGKTKPFPLVLAIASPQRMTDFKNIADEIIKINKKNGLILPIFPGGEKVKEARKKLIENRIPVYNFPEDILHILDIIDKGDKKKSVIPLRAGIREEKFLKIKRILQKYSCEWIPLEDSLKIAENLSFPIAKSFLANAEGSLEDVLKDISFPLVIKTSVAEIIHKAKAGQVFCDIMNKNELLNAFRKIKKPAVIQHQEKKDAELIIGAKKDKNFGTMLMFGLGGVMANEINRAKFYVMPLNEDACAEIIKECPLSNLFSETINEELLDIIVALQKLMLGFSQIDEIDLNPVLINLSEDKVVCPDVKVKIS